MAYYADVSTLVRQRDWFVEKIQELLPESPEKLLRMIEPGNLAEIYFKLRDNLEGSAHGIREDFANGDDSKSGLDQDWGNGNAAREKNYRIPFRKCGHKNAGIMALGFNRRSNTVDEYYFPKGSFTAQDIEVNYRKETNEPSGKYSKYLVKRHLWR